MNYASTADLVSRFGEFEIEQLAPTDEPGQYDDDRLAAAIADAEAEADSYLGQRYTVPISVVNPALKAAVCDIARYNLFAAQATEEVKTRYQQRIAWLRDISNNKASLGHIDGNTPSTISAAISNNGGRIFTRDKLAGF